MTHRQRPLDARATALALGVSLGLVCCELVINTSHLDSEDGSDGGGGDVEPGVDARRSGDAGPPRDGKTPGDATRPEDTGSPGDGGPPADARGFCATQPDAQFCDDFDDGSVTFALPMVWESPYLVNATMSLDDHAWRSPPASLEVVLSSTEDADASKSVAKLQTVLSGTLSQFHVAFDLRVDVADTVTGSEFYPFDVTFGDDTDYFTLYLDLTSNGTVSKSGAAIYCQRQAGDARAPDQTFAFSRAPDAGAWTHVDIFVTLKPDSGILNAALNDASVLEDVSFATGGSNQNPQLELGGTVFAPTKEWEAHFDNFVVRFQ